MKRSFRLFCYGYRMDEVNMPPIAGTKAFDLKAFRKSDPVIRPVVQVSLGCPLDGFAQPHPCPGDTDTMVAGVMKRIAAKTPTPNRAMLRRLRSFVRKWLKKNLTPLAPDSDTTFESWIEKTNYPLHRKEELREKWSRIPDQWTLPKKILSL
jgi:hypothetical protein